MTRTRLRDLGIRIGRLPSGPLNAITDVEDVWVGHSTVIHDAPRVARTGVTVIRPRAGEIFRDHCFAGYHSFNGNGEMTGLLWVKESGELGTPIAITNTHQVGVVRDTLVEVECSAHPDARWLLPVVAETYDGWLNDIDAFHVTREHVLSALANAAPGPVAEGCVGGGTGMICHEFKGGIGTSSRLATIGERQFTVGVLVQANYGVREDLRLNGAPVGEWMPTTDIPGVYRNPAPGAGSIIVVIATDAPLLPNQCTRLAQRATVGLSRVGGVGHNGSGDIFLAFSTGNHLPEDGTAWPSLTMTPNQAMTPLFYATVEAVEEAIWNALCAAETTIGQQNRTVYAIDLQQLQAMMNRNSERGNHDEA